MNFLSTKKVFGVSTKAVLSLGIVVLMAALIAPQASFARGGDSQGRGGNGPRTEQIAGEQREQQNIQNNQNGRKGTGGRNQDGPTRINLRYTGLLQLAAHDLFNVDRETEVDSENGLLDLSTVLDHGDENITLGGEARNQENPLNFTVAADYGNRYLALLDEGKTVDAARAAVVAQYHRELARAYKKLFGEDMPAAAAGTVTMTENLAFRTVHDVLPGEIRVNGERLSIFDESLAGVSLSRDDLKRKGDTVNGQINDVFLNIVFETPAGEIVVDLLERDSSFAQQFNTEVTFEELMAQLEDGKYNTDDLALQFIRTLFAKGLSV